MKLQHYILTSCLVWGSVCAAQQAYIDSLETIIARNHHDLETARAMNLVSTKLVRVDVEKAKGYLWRAKALGKTLKDDQTLGTAYSQLVSIYQNEARLDSAVTYLASLKKLSDAADAPDADIIKANYFSTAGLYYKKSGDRKRGLTNLLKSHELHKKLGNVVSASGQALNIGNCYLVLSDYNAALEYYLMALEGFEKTANKRGQSFCYQNMGNCYVELKKYDDALKYANKSIRLKRELGDKRGLASADNLLGNIYTGLENYEKAISHYSSALATSIEMKNVMQEMTNHFQIGKLYSYKGEGKNAISHFEKSKALAKTMGDSTVVVSAELEIFNIKKKSTQQEEIESNALENIQTLQLAGVKSREAVGYKNLAAYYAQTKQFDKALEYTNRYHSLRDSIYNSEVQVQFKKVEALYQNEKNEKQITLLQKDREISNQKLKEQRILVFIFGLIIIFIGFSIWLILNRNKLSQKMKELELRNRISADLHDEVGSSLSSIYMLSQMAGQTKFESRGDILTKLSANAFETMEKMGDFVWMIKPTDNDGAGLKERMERFVHELCDSREIECRFSGDAMDGLKLSMKQKKNLYLIFKEAVNNAVKYSNSLVLEVKISTENKNLNMVIEDHGNGFDANKIIKGNGLENMHFRAKELKGKLVISSKPLEGTRLHLSFPIN